MLQPLDKILCWVFLLPSGFLFQTPSQPGQLKVTSTPTGAAIRINGNLMPAKTDATFVVNPGDYTVEVTSGSNKLNCKPPSVHVYSGQQAEVDCQ